MERFKQYLEERVINVFPKQASSKYKPEDFIDEVWDILVSSYAAIGGMHGNGFKSKEDMIANIPMWKLIRKGGKIVTVAMYKDKKGRKRVAVGTNGTPAGKEGLRMIVTEDVKMHRSYGEISGPSLGFFMKTTAEAESHFLEPKVVEKLLKDKLTYPIRENIPELVKFPQLRKFAYSREIGGEDHIKFAVGSPGKSLRK
jgi:hypothetical protein